MARERTGYTRWHLFVKKGIIFLVVEVPEQQIGSHANEKNLLMNISYEPINCLSFEWT